MFKKVFLAVALAITASFATWDYFPIRPAGSGTGEAGLYYDWDHSWSQAGISAGARFSLLPVLELSVVGFGFQFWGEEDCDGCANGGRGLRDVTVGGRFQITPMVSAFLDAHLPIGREESDGYATTPRCQCSAGSRNPDLCRHRTPDLRFSRSRYFEDCSAV